MAAEGLASRSWHARKPKLQRRGGWREKQVYSKAGTLGGWRTPVQRQTPASQLDQKAGEERQNKGKVQGWE